MRTENSVAIVPKRIKSSAKVKRVAVQTALYLVLAVLALIVLLPFYFMLESSFKTYGEALGTFTWFPKEPSVEGYRYILGNNPYNINLLGNFGITLLITVPTMLVGVFVSALAAFTFAKRQFDGNGILFSILLFTMMIPGTILMMPQYIIFADLDLIGTVIPLMLPGMFGSATCVFFLRQFIRGIPDSLIDAAKLDGMNYVKIFVYLILPLSWPALISQIVLWFIGGYNDYMGPLIYLQSNDVSEQTLQVALAYFSSSQNSGMENIPAIMASSVLSIIPLLVLYIAFQKFFISGIAVSGMKD